MSSAFICGLSCLLILATFWQDFGGTLAFQGQDIIGGAAVIFKAPKRVKDLVGGAAAMMAVRRPPRSGRSSDVARTNRSDRRPPARPSLLRSKRPASKLRLSRMMETHFTIAASMHRRSKPIKKQSSSRRRIPKHRHQLATPTSHLVVLQKPPPLTNRQFACKLTTPVLTATSVMRTTSSGK